MIVWLASYPRSGNTFFRVLLKNFFGQKTYSIYNDSTGIGEDQKTTDLVGHAFLPENFDYEEAKKSEELFLIKTHDLPSDLVKGDKFIYLIRDGRESVLSYQKHLEEFSENDVDLSEIILGNVNFGSWANHVMQWNTKSFENGLVIKFEEMVRDPRKTLKRVSDFIGLPLLESSVPSFEELNKVNPRFFRSGETSSWKHRMSGEEIGIFNLTSAHMLTDFGYESTASPIYASKISLLLSSYLSDVADCKKLSRRISQLDIQAERMKERNEDLRNKNKGLIAENEIHRTLRNNFVWRKPGNRERKTVTVVTVAFNAARHIQKTIESVISQTSNDFEYILVDGGSTDGTLKIIKNYRDSVDVIVSEADKGIYDAMNKAVDLARGEWIIFMNSNDWFTNDSVLEDVFSQNHKDADFLYGDHKFTNGSQSFSVPARSLSTMWQRISFSHQALFSRTELMKKHKFDLSKQVVADYDFYYKCYVSGYKFVYVKNEIAVVSDGGFSSISFLRRTWERWMVVRKYTPSAKVNAFYSLLLLWRWVPSKMKKFLKNKMQVLRKLP